MPRKRSITFWVLGTICIFFGMLMIAAIDFSMTAEVMIAYLISFILLLIGGMFWIAVPTIHIPE